MTNRKCKTCGVAKIALSVTWAKGQTVHYCQSHYPRLIGNTGFHLR